MMDRRELIAGTSAALGLAALPRLAQAATSRFPAGFLWGASTAGHQIEGNNTHSDYWVLEHVEPRAFATPSGDAANSLHLWSADLDLARDLGLNCYRFSLEWSRIEPEEGHFSNAMLDYYARIIDGCVERGLLPVVTFNHFTAPRWFTMAGNWANPASPDMFARYCERTARRLAGKIGYAVTLNEPNLPAFLHWVNLPAPIIAVRRANREAAARSLGVERFDAGFSLDREAYAPMVANLQRAHRMGRAAIKSVRPGLPVGMALAVADEQAVVANSHSRVKRAEVYEPWFEAGQDDDYVGVQNYTRIRMDQNGVMRPPEGAPMSSAHLEIYPPSLANAVRQVYTAVGKKILITEHGVASPDDRVRVELIKAALPSLAEVISGGVPVLGYIHWSLIDNYEWYSGFGQQLGLAQVDPVTFARTPKLSGLLLGQIARANALPARISPL